MYIGKYRPAAMELPTRLKPFIPEFIPAIGGTDEFIKVPRPDGKPDYLGLKVGATCETAHKRMQGWSKDFLVHASKGWSNEHIDTW